MLCGPEESKGTLDWPCRSLKSGRFSVNMLAVVVFDVQFFSSGPKNLNLPPLRTLSGIISCRRPQRAITEEQLRGFE